MTAENIAAFAEVMEQIERKTLTRKPASVGNVRSFQLIDATHSANRPAGSCRCNEENDRDSVTD